jgi:hypothetical protein
VRTGMQDPERVVVVASNNDDLAVW